MSLLMQALKKAEHAKQKKQGEVDAAVSDEKKPSSIRSEELSLSAIAPREEPPAPAANPEQNDEPATSFSSYSEPINTTQTEQPQTHTQDDAASAVMQDADPFGHLPVDDSAGLRQPAQTVAREPEPVHEDVADKTIDTPPASVAASAIKPHVRSESMPDDEGKNSARVEQARATAEAARASLLEAKKIAASRQTAKTVFVAKQKPKRRAVYVVMSLILIGLLGAGGYVVWQATAQPSNIFLGAATPLPVTPPPAPQAAPPGTVALNALPAEPAQANSGTATAPGLISQAPQAVSTSKNSSDRDNAGASGVSGAPVKSAVATTDAQTAMREQPDNPAIQIRQTSPTNQVNPALSNAYQSFQSGDLGAAQQQYQKVLQHEPNSRDALLGMAAIALNRRQSELASGYYGKLLDLDPADPDAIAGLVSLQQGDPSLNESRLKKILAQNPQSGSVLFELGNLYAKQSRWAEAQQSYFRAYTTAPGNGNYAFNLAVSLDKLGQSKLALEYYQKALASNAGNFNHASIQNRIRELQAAAEN